MPNSEDLNFWLLREGVNGFPFSLPSPTGEAHFRLSIAEEQSDLID
jgi:hypothetical protein